MVARRFHAAQKKIAQSSVGNQIADSPEEWFRLNCPDLDFKES